VEDVHINGHKYAHPPLVALGGELARGSSCTSQLINGMESKTQILVTKSECFSAWRFSRSK